LQPNNRLRQYLNAPWFPLAAVALALVLSLPALFFDLSIDDWLHKMVLEGRAGEFGFSDTSWGLFEFVNGDPERISELRDFGYLPWWTADNLLLSFWRPFTVATHIADYALWPGSPVLMHLHTLGWMAACILAAWTLYRRLMPAAWMAGLAALLFAIDDGHSMPIGWLANRNGFIALFFALLAIQWHIRAREKGEWHTYAAALVAFLMALLSKEEGLSVLAYLVPFALFLDSGSWRARLASLAPYAVIVIAWRVVYRMMGHGVWGSEYYRDPLLSPVAFAEAIVTRLPLLMLGQWTGPPSELEVVVPVWLRLPFWLLGVAVTLGVLLLLWKALRHDRLARFYTGGMLLSLVPVCATFPSDRLLLFSGIGAFGLVAQLNALSFSGEEPFRPVFRRVAWALIIIHLALASVLLPVRIAAFGVFGSETNRILLEAPVGESLEEKTVILVETPVAFMASYLPLIRAAHGLPVPAYTRSIGPNKVGGVGEVVMTRVDARTLRVEAPGGYPWILARNSGLPFETGDTVELTGLTVEVESVNATGHPTQVRYTFAHPLEDARYVWLRFDEQAIALVPWQPPPAPAP
jgi:hypothetical protein